MASIGHTVVTVEKTPDGWVAECLECERRVAINHAALHSGHLAECETTLEPGDRTVSHSWSTRPDLLLGGKLG